MNAMNKPDCILNYNCMMGGVAKSDQVLESYDTTRKKNNGVIQKACNSLLC